MTLKHLVFVGLILILLLTLSPIPLHAQTPGPELQKSPEKALNLSFEELPLEIQTLLAPAYRQAQWTAPRGPQTKCCALRIAYRILRDRNGKMLAIFYQIVEHCWDNGILTTARVSIVHGIGYPEQEGPGWKYLGITGSGSTGGVGQPSFNSGQTGKFGYWDGTQYTQYAYLSSFITINGDGTWSSNTGDTILP